MAYVTFTARAPRKIPLFVNSYSTILTTEHRTRKTRLFEEPKNWFKTFAGRSSKSSPAFRTNIRDKVFCPWFSTFFAPEYPGYVSIFQTIICVLVVHFLSLLSWVTHFREGLCKIHWIFIVYLKFFLRISSPCNEMSNHHTALKGRSISDNRSSIGQECLDIPVGI